MDSKRTIVAGLLVVMLGGTMISCSENEREEVGKDMQTLEEQTAEQLERTREELRVQREAFVEQANARIEKNQNDIDDLRMVAATKSADAKVEYEKAIEDLRVENERLKARIEQNRQATAENWEKFKEEFNHDMNNLGQSVQDLFRDNK